MTKGPVHLYQPHNREATYLDKYLRPTLEAPGYFGFAKVFYVLYAAPCSRHELQCFELSSNVRAKHVAKCSDVRAPDCMVSSFLFASCNKGKYS
jgi:hypothetical protein